MVSQSNISVRQNKALSTVRSVFVINPRKEVSLIMTYPVQIGRNFDEILRAVDALQRNEKYNVITPANWVHGDETIVPPLYSDEDAIEKFGYMQKKTDHVRFTKDPMVMSHKGKGADGKWVDVPIEVNVTADDATGTTHDGSDDASDDGYNEFLAFLNGANDVK
ncbi:hypothetical protein ACHAWO_008821 [Cyclotella atomus]|uniref:Peroxiredoxin C-terminal domain-containing protein n=1 Tax=Cyclotella atomus TaxID=382360 RepID=A0ABD3QMU9_9STRA